MTAPSLGSTRPSREQECLLRAILLDGDPAASAWAEWRARVELDHVDEGSFRLLPMAWVRCRSFEPDAGWLQRLKGVHRQAWYRNQLVRERALTVVAALEGAGIPTLLLKGLAVSALYYPDGAARPMMDADILVPEAAADRVPPVLSSLGLRPSLPWPPGYGQAVDFRSGHEGIAVDVHLHVLQECVWPGADREFWEHAAPFELDGVPTRTLSPTDQLLHVVLHGLRHCRVPPVRWVTDAVLLLRRDGERIDWDRLLVLARERRVLWTLGAGLGYLAAAHGVEIPRRVAGAVSAHRPTRSERFAHWARLHRPGILGELPRLWSEYRRLEGFAGSPPPVTGFVSFLRRAWDVHGWGAFLVLLARKAGRRLRAVLGPQPGSFRP